MQSAMLHGHMSGGGQPNMVPTSCAIREMTAGDVVTRCMTSKSSKHSDNVRCPAHDCLWSWTHGGPTSGEVRGEPCNTQGV
jgi:hypothetical protein